MAGRAPASSAPPPPPFYSHAVQNNARLERHLEERARVGCSHASTSTSSDAALMYATTAHPHLRPTERKKRGPKAGKKAALAAAAAAAAASAAASAANWISPNGSQTANHQLMQSATRPSSDPYAFHAGAAETSCYGEQQQQQQQVSWWSGSGCPMQPSAVLSLCVPGENSSIHVVAAKVSLC